MCRGPTAQILKRDGPVAVKRAVRLTGQALTALEYALGKKLHPSN